MMGPGITNKDLKIIKELGIFSQVRGVHGSGIYQVSTNSNISYGSNLLFKTSSPFVNLLEEKYGHGKTSPYKSILDTCMPNIIMGHVRAATRGVISDANAHPFMFSNIVGAHNGTLEDKKYHCKDKTDSELMFADINERGILPVIEEMDKESAFAIVMYHKQERQMYFVRNCLRPLAFALLADRSVLYWATESDMLRYVLRRNGEDGFKIFNLKEDHLISINPTDINRKNLDENPIGGVIKSVSNLNRKLPERVQKARDIIEAKKKAEENKSEIKTQLPAPIEPKITTKIISQQNSTSNGNVLKFPRNSYTSCFCGKTTLNLLEAWRARSGHHEEIFFDGNKNIYICRDCEVKNGSTAS